MMDVVYNVVRSLYEDEYVCMFVKVESCTRPVDHSLFRLVCLYEYLSRSCVLMQGSHLVGLIHRTVRLFRTPNPNLLVRESDADSLSKIRHIIEHHFMLNHVIDNSTGSV